MDNMFFKSILERLEALERKSDVVRFGTVEHFEPAGVSARLDGDQTTGKKLFKRLDSYSPTVGDRVLLVRKGNANEHAYVILGKVVG